MRMFLRTTIIGASFALAASLGASAAPTSGPKGPACLTISKASGTQLATRRRCQTQCCNYDPDAQREICRCCEEM